MSKIRLAAVLLLAPLALACTSEEETTPAPDGTATGELPPDHPPVTPGQTAPAPAAAAMLEGEVLETLDAGRYTYVRLRARKTEEEVWVAGPRTDLEVGGTVGVAGSIVMQDFHSDVLDRTFESIMFVDRIRVM